MVYIMRLYTDGGCRRNGYQDAIGAAAVIRRLRWRGKVKKWVDRLPLDPTPTNQRAEITAVIMALEQVLLRYDELNGSPRLRVTIHTDSTYVIDCMTKWMYKWTRNGWIDSRNTQVVNRDLLETAIQLQKEVRQLGRLRYIKATRAQVQDVDDLCNHNMDIQEGRGD